MKIFLRLSVAALLLAILAGQSLAAPIGQVSGVRPGASVDRDGESIALKLKDSIEAKDTLHTDASGRVQVLFADNTTVTLGPNTTLTMEEFAFEEGEPTFKANLGQGIVRTITGAIVERNPKGFGIITPEATVGIRGTIITTSSKDGSTTVWVENTTRHVFVNNIDVLSGQKITISSLPPQVQPITPQDRTFVEDELATLQPRESAPGTPTPPSPVTALPEMPLTTQTEGDNLPVNNLPTPPTPPTPPGPPGPPGPQPVVTTAIISGTLGGVFFPSLENVTSGAFFFNVTLASGAISNAAMSALYTNGREAFNLTSGTGSMAPDGSFSISNFAGTVTSRIPATTVPVDPSRDTTIMTGNPTGSIPAVGGPVSGSYTVHVVRAPLGVILRPAGPFTGTRTQ